MSSAKGSGKRRGKDPESLRSEKKRKRVEEDDLNADPDLSSDIKGIMMALQNIEEKTKKEEQQKSEETITGVAPEIRCMIDDAKSKIEKERQTYLKALSKSAMEYESTLKNEYNKFQAAYDKFSKEKAAHMQSSKGKKDKAALSELEMTCADKIANAEEILKKKKQDDKHFSILRKSLGSFFESCSDDDFGHDD